VEGTVLLFPGWLPHAVLPFGTSTGAAHPPGDRLRSHPLRISVSFNLDRDEELDDCAPALTARAPLSEPPCAIRG